LLAHVVDGPKRILLPTEDSHSRAPQVAGLRLLALLTWSAALEGIDVSIFQKNRADLSSDKMREETVLLKHA
jgi:hypothetical protein